MGKGILQVSDNRWVIAPATTNSTKTQACLPGVGSALSTASKFPAGLAGFYKTSISTSLPRPPSSGLASQRSWPMAYPGRHEQRSIYSKECTTARVSLSKSGLVNHGVVY